jgi:inosine-uridine nucleoside N-ribohydrolase
MLSPRHVMRHFSLIHRRSFLKRSVAGVLGAWYSNLGFCRPAAWLRHRKRAVPVILATDIGDDIDDTWALGFLLKCPELELKLALSEYGKPDYRGRLLAKFLQTTGHGHVPVGLGPEVEPRGEGGQAAWVKGYDLSTYPGRVHRDGVQAMIDIIMGSSEPVTVIGIGPLPNVASALRREPRIAQRARFVGMDGSVRLGYGGSKAVSAEWNVKADIKAAQAVLSAGWDITITPLDTCGLVTLDGPRYRRVVEALDPICSTIIENYRIWNHSNKNNADAERHSSVLFDTVAVYLAFAHDLCRMERLGIRVSDDGFTRVEDQGKPMQVATQWATLDGYRDFLVDRLAGG